VPELCGTATVWVMHTEEPCLYRAVLMGDAHMWVMHTEEHASTALSWLKVVSKVIVSCATCKVAPKLRRP